ncbi:MAG TPA: hypothetical protein VG324_16160, partial [Blastocatellia bacterium]|nr:hypothetical protein [Blastocatellia bacterium]
MNKRNYFLSSAFSVILVLACATRWHAQQEADNQDAQAISQTGLLPVYGVDFAFDPAWVDAERFPSQSTDFPNFGVNAAFQKVWDALTPSGFNAIRFPIDARDAQGAANRVANLCLWAQKNNTRLVPILVGAERGRQPGGDFSANVSAFVNALLANLRGADGQGVQAYTQILFYQLENGMNHAGWHGAMAPQSSQLRILQAASALRRAEQEWLKETGLNATPLIVNASFDYEMIKARALAGATLDDRAYSQAYESLKQFLVEISASADIDVIGVEWFPGSVSAGGMDKVPALLRSLRADLGGKQIIFATGCSSAFRSPEEQKKFYALAFTTLADYRASEGVDSPFIGVFFHEALNGKDSNPAPPTPKLAGEMKRWDWAAKSDEMMRMWSGQGTSDGLTWWLKKVENNMGLIGLESDRPNSPAVSAQPAQEGLQQIATIVSEANATATDASQANAAAPESGVSPIPDPVATGAAEGSAADSSDDSTGSGIGAALKDKAQQALMLLLDRLFEKFGNVISGLGSNTGGNPGESAPGAGATPSIALAKEDVSLAP